jgi:Protein of unknown function (DUF2806)
MADGGSLININLSDLSKPATVLVEKVCNAVGMLYEPKHIKRVAKAEAAADEIRALGRIRTSALERRAMKRLVHQEARKQENIEQITSQAAKSLPQDAKVQDLDEDWVAHFFKQCDTVSDKEMQSLWARLLSGEATKSGTFSKRTVDFVSSMDKKDAKLFTSFCQFVWVVEELTPLIYEANGDIYVKHGISFGSLKHLDAIGLISFEAVSGYMRKGRGKYWLVSYYGRGTLIEFLTDGEQKFMAGHVLLTTTGKELAPVCGSPQNEEFYQYVIQKWFQQGLILSSIIPR